MGIQLNKDACQKLITENIKALEKYMPEHSLEKKHTIEVLKWSIDQIYTSGKANAKMSDSGLNIPIVMESASDAFDRGFTAGYDSGIKLGLKA